LQAPATEGETTLGFTRLPD